MNKYDILLENLNLNCKYYEKFGGICGALEDTDMQDFACQVGCGGLLKNCEVGERLEQDNIQMNGSR